MQNQQTVENLTPEQILEMEQKMNKFYDENTPLLEKRCKYEELKARIEQANYNFMEAMAKQANLHAQMNQKNAEKKPSDEPKSPA